MVTFLHTLPFLFYPFLALLCGLLYSVGVLPKIRADEAGLCHGPAGPAAPGTGPGGGRQAAAGPELPAAGSPESRR